MGRKGHFSCSMHRLTPIFVKPLKPHLISAFSGFTTNLLQPSPTPNNHPQNDAVSSILTHLTQSFMTTRGSLNYSLKIQPLFKNLLTKIDPFQAEQVILYLLSKNQLETVLEDFFALRNGFGVEHSMRCYFTIAHVLAGLSRARALKFHLMYMVQQEGMLIAVVYDILFQQEGMLMNRNEK